MGPVLQGARRLARGRRQLRGSAASPAYRRQARPRLRWGRGGAGGEGQRPSLQMQCRAPLTLRGGGVVGGRQAVLEGSWIQDFKSRGCWPDRSIGCAGGGELPWWRPGPAGSCARRVNKLALATAAAAQPLRASTSLCAPRPPLPTSPSLASSLREKIDHLSISRQSLNPGRLEILDSPVLTFWPSLLCTLQLGPSQLLLSPHPPPDTLP